jgi:hypothetical protein
VTVTLAGNGEGLVTSTDTAIDCGAICAHAYANGSVVTLNAAPSPGSIFSGWLGACTGLGPCILNISSAANVSATFVPDTVQLRIDVDGNGSYDPETDGLLMLRYLFELTGTALTSGAIGPGMPMRSMPAEILEFLNNIRPLLDVDGNGQPDALTDGLLIIRHLFGLSGPALVIGAIGDGATRTTEQIGTYLRDWFSSVPVTCKSVTMAAALRVFGRPVPAAKTIRKAIAPLSAEPVDAHRRDAARRRRAAGPEDAVPDAEQLAGCNSGRRRRADGWTRCHSGVAIRAAGVRAAG